MASARSAWGIDIGNRALKAVKLVREGDGLRVDDFEIIEHETVLSSSGDNRDSLIQSALANFVQRKQPKGTPVSVAVSGQQSFARFIKLPPVEEKKIPEIVKFEAIQQIPFPLDDVEWAYQLFRDPDSPDVEVGIFAMRKELLASHIKFFTDVDLNVQAVQLSPLAVYNAMFYDAKIKGTTMLIDLGAENTDLVIADQNSIWMRTIPIGGNNFTDTLVKAFKLNFAKAEDLKRNAATSKYARQIFQAMRPVFADLVAEIQRSVGFYSSVHRDSRIKKALAIGGTFKLPGLQKYLQQNLSLDLERLDSLTAAPPADSKIGPNFAENALSLVTAYGLAVQGVGDAKVDSSLLPQKIRREKMWKEKTKWFAAAAALFVAGTALSAGAYYFHDLSFKANEGIAGQIDSIKGEAERLSGEWQQQVQDVGGPERQRILNVRSMELGRTLWGDILTDIAKALPVPPPELLKGDVEAIKKTPRDQRKLVTLDSINTVYVPNLQPLLSGKLENFANLVGLTVAAIAPTTPDPNAGGEQTAPLDPNAPADPNAPRGFLVLARVTSTNANASQLVNETLLRNLVKIGPTPDNPKVAYAIPKATIVTAQRIENDANRMTKIKSDYDAALKGKGFQAPNLAGGNMGGGFTTGGGFVPQGGNEGGFSPGGFSPGGFAPQGGFQGGGQVNAIDDVSPYLDRLTGEDVRKDWQMNVLFLIQLDPPAAQPAPGAPTASAGQ